MNKRIEISSEEIDQMHEDLNTISLFSHHYDTIFNVREPDFSRDQRAYSRAIASLRKQISKLRQTLKESV